MIDWQDVVNDPSLSPEACRIVLHVLSKGDGEHEISHAEFRRLLGRPSPRVLREAVQDAADLYLIRTAGGRGHHDRYQLRVSPSAQPKADRVSLQAQPKAPVVVVEEVGDTPFDSPEPLDVRALRAIEQAGDKLSGCRGALRDYLQSRVPHDHQYGYVQAVVSWIENPLTTFRQPDGSPVPASERTKMLAVALNEMAATDEATRKYKAGDPANLRVKLSNVIRETFRKLTETRATGTHGRSKRDLPPDAQDYTIKPYQGLNG